MSHLKRSRMDASDAFLEMKKKIADTHQLKAQIEEQQDRMLQLETKLGAAAAAAAARVAKLSRASKATQTEETFAPAKKLAKLGKGKAKACQTEETGISLGDAVSSVEAAKRHLDTVKAETLAQLANKKKLTLS